MIGLDERARGLLERVVLGVAVCALSPLVLNVTTAAAAPDAALTVITRGPLSLVLEPGAGSAPLYALLPSPRRSLDLVMYELVDPHAESLLVADAARGVRVRVILDERGEQQQNEAAHAFLTSHGVAVRWASSRFDLTHEKAFVLDGRIAVVMTLNLTDRYYASTRDVAVVDNDAVDAAAIETTFGADWSGAPLVAPTGDDLLWSPGAEQPLLALIASARTTLLVENEEMADAWITSALESAARRGVRVEVVMTESSSWAAALSALEAAGVRVRVYAPSATLYIHAKIVVVDPGSATQRAFVGSENFSVASLLYNRELGIETRQADVVAQLARVVEQDGAGAAPWQ